MIKALSLYSQTKLLLYADFQEKTNTKSKKYKEDKHRNLSLLKYDLINIQNFHFFKNKMNSIKGFADARQFDPNTL